MGWRRYFLLVSLCYLSVKRSDGYVEAVSASVDVSQVGSEMQVAMACDKGDARYHNQYMDASGEWITDFENKKTCMKSKNEILDYCNLVYPAVIFSGVKESSHSYIIDNWCKVGHAKCDKTFRVKSYKCIQRDHQSDFLSVPLACRSDHLQNGSQCLNDHEWSQAANQSCKDHGMTLDGFSTKHVCDDGTYSRVEFVCCPRKDKKMKGFGKKAHSWKQDDVDGGVEDVTPLPEGSERATRDPYFTKFDPRIEHHAFKAAERRLEASHRRKITKIMQEWTELEERYQKIKMKSPQKADKFKLKMTERFNRMMNALKDQGSVEKHQLVDLHQQRIIAHINERKKDGMKCFVKALNEKPPSSTAVEKCLNHLIRALYKDRHHTISHFQHLLLINPDNAKAQQAATVEHLHDIERMVNESLQMLDRYPDIRAAVLLEMTRMADELRRRDVTPAELITTHVVVKPDLAQAAPPAGDIDWTHDDVNRIDIDVEVDRRPAALAEQHVEPLPVHAQAHWHAQSEATYQLVGAESSGGGGSRGLYVTVALASLALAVALVAGVAGARRRRCPPRHKGFIEVDQAVSPEERHLAQMQVNGYENPTYRYFESK